MIEIFNSKNDNEVTKLTLEYNEENHNVKFIFKTTDESTTLYLDGYEDIDISIPSKSYLLCKNSMTIKDNENGKIDNISSLELTSIKQMFGQNYCTILTLLVSAALAIVDIDENNNVKIYTSVSTIDFDPDKFSLTQSDLAFNRLKGEFGY